MIHAQNASSQTKICKFFQNVLKCLCLKNGNLHSKTGFNTCAKKTKSKLSHFVENFKTQDQEQGINGTRSEDLFENVGSVTLVGILDSSNKKKDTIGIFEISE